MAGWPAARFSKITSGLWDLPFAREGRTVKTAPFHPLIGTMLLLAAGCAPSEYQPSLLPLFFGAHAEELAVQPVGAPVAEPVTEKPGAPSEPKPAPEANREEKLP